MRVILFLSLFAFTSSQTCPVPPPEDVIYQPVGSGSDNFDPVSFDSRGLEPYYNMANGFSDIVRSGSLPYNIITPRISNIQSVDTNAIIQEVLSWYAPVLAVTVLGFVLALLTCISLCCVCCCRCCKNCGGNLTWTVDDEEKEGNRKCLCVVQLVFVLIFIILAGVGIVFAFLTNEAFKDTTNSVVPTVTNTLRDTSSFVNTTLAEVRVLVGDRLGDFTGNIQDLLTNVEPCFIDEIVDSHRGDFNILLNEVLGLQNNVGSINGALNNISTTLIELNTTAANISGQLEAIRSSLDNLRASCMGSALMTSFDCSSLDSSAIPIVDVSPEIDQALTTLQMFQNSLNYTQNLTDFVMEINQTFNRLSSNITGQFNLTSQIDPFVNQIEDIQNSVIDSLSNGVDTVNRALADFTTSVEEFNEMFVNNPELSYSVSNLFLARYIVGILFCVFILFGLIFVVLGLLCGLVGYNKSRLPFERTQLSNCGGICLLVSSYVLFILAFFLFIIAAFMFPFGTFGRKVCLAVQDPEYEIFGQPDLVQLLRETIENANSGLANIPIDIPGSLRACREDATLWNALQAEAILRSLPADIIPNISVPPIDLLDIAKVLEDGGIDGVNLTAIRMSIKDTVSSFDLSNLIPNTLIDDIRNLIPNVTDLDIITISIQSANDTLNSAPANFTSIRTTLMNISSVANAINETSIQNDADSILANINTTEALLMQAQTEINQLSEQVQNTLDMAQSAINTTLQQLNQTLQNAETFINTTTTSVQNGANMAIDEFLQYIRGFQEFLLMTLREDAFQCGEISNIYVRAVNLICRQTINQLNGFWFAIGWCAIFFIALLAWTIPLSKQFRKHRDADTILRPNEDYPEYQLESYYNPSAANRVQESTENGLEGQFNKAKESGYPALADPRNGTGDDLWVANNNNTIDL